MITIKTYNETQNIIEMESYYGEILLLMTISVIQ